MPVLGKRDADIKVVLPSSTPEDEAYVMVKSKLLLGDLKVVEAPYGDRYEQTVASLEMYITDWNFTDANGEKVPITKDSILNFDRDDYNYIVDNYLAQAIAAINKATIDSEQKKTLSDTSTPSTPVVPQA